MASDTPGLLLLRTSPTCNSSFEEACAVPAAVPMQPPDAEPAVLLSEAPLLGPQALDCDFGTKLSYNMIQTTESSLSPASCLRSAFWKKSGSLQSMGRALQVPFAGSLHPARPPGRLPEARSAFRPPRALEPPGPAPEAFRRRFGRASGSYVCRWQDVF